MQEALKQSIQATLKAGSYEIYHETSRNQDSEIVFTLLPKNYFNHPDFEEFFKQYSNKNPLAQLTDMSLDYISSMKDFYPVRLAVIDKESIFEASEIEFIEKNSVNYISKALTGSVVDESAEFDALFDTYKQRAGALVNTIVGMGSVGIQKLKEQDPEKIFDAGAKKVASTLSFFRKQIKDAVDSNRKPKP